METGVELIYGKIRISDQTCLERTKTNLTLLNFTQMNILERRLDYSKNKILVPIKNLCLSKALSAG